MSKKTKTRVFVALRCLETGMYPEVVEKEAGTRRIAEGDIFFVTQAQAERLLRQGRAVLYEEGNR